MKMYVATVEVDQRDLSPDRADDLLESLGQHHGAVGESPRGWIHATITFPAEDLPQAVVTAVAIVQTATGGNALSVEAMTEKERDARAGWDVDDTELVSVTEAAEELGVSRQAVLDRISRKTLPAEKIGRSWAIPRAALAAVST